MNILVTGGAGFVGRALLKALMARGGCSLRTSVRPGGHSVCLTGVDVVVADLAPETDWAEALVGVDAVVHTAARVHIMDDRVVDPLAEFRRTNVAGTLALARQAAAAGVRRFVYISSIKVNGEGTLVGRPFTAEGVPAPRDAYGMSKMEAEQGLRKIAAGTGMEVVIIRPPLIYGPGVRANFEALMRAVARGLPLPLGSIHNLRSLVSLDNLVDFIDTCLQHPQAANQTFLVSDGEDVSTPELVRRMARTMRRPARLLPVPMWLLRAGAGVLGKWNMAQRLCGSLQVDSSKARQLLGWIPPQTLDESLRKAVEGYVRETGV